MELDLTTVEVKPRAESVTNDDERHVDIFSLIWLDTDDSLRRHPDAELKLRDIINHLRYFEDPKQCQIYIEQRSKEDRVVLVVNEQLGHEIIPLIHQLRQVLSIYIYGPNEHSIERKEKWTNDFRKVGLLLEY